MKKMKIKAEDKKLIKAFYNWHITKGYNPPREYDCSNLIDNMNCDHRNLVEEFLEELISKKGN